MNENQYFITNNFIERTKGTLNENLFYKNLFILILEILLLILTIILKLKILIIFHFQIYRNL